MEAATGEVIGTTDDDDQELATVARAFMEYIHRFMTNANSAGTSRALELAVQEATHGHIARASKPPEQQIRIAPSGQPTQQARTSWQAELGTELRHGDRGPHSLLAGAFASSTRERAGVPSDSMDAPLAAGSKRSRHEGDVAPRSATSLVAPVALPETVAAHMSGPSEGQVPVRTSDASNSPVSVSFRGAAQRRGHGSDGGRGVGIVVE